VSNAIDAGERGKKKKPCEGHIRAPILPPARFYPSLLFLARRKRSSNSLSLSLISFDYYTVLLLYSTFPPTPPLPFSLSLSCSCQNRQTADVCVLYSMLWGPAAVLHTHIGAISTWYISLQRGLLYPADGFRVLQLETHNFWAAVICSRSLL
jgi:hypothetical protein